MHGKTSGAQVRIPRPSLRTLHLLEVICLFGLLGFHVAQGNGQHINSKSLSIGFTLYLVKAFPRPPDCPCLLENVYKIEQAQMNQTGKNKIMDCF